MRHGRTDTDGNRHMYVRTSAGELTYRRACVSTSEGQRQTTYMHTEQGRTHIYTRTQAEKQTYTRDSN